MEKPYAVDLRNISKSFSTQGKTLNDISFCIQPGEMVALIRAVGAGLLGQIRFSVLPQVFPLWSSYALYRFESNVRAATVLDIVGAGGIGQSLYESIRTFDYREACTILLIIILSASLIDMVSARLRTITV